MTGPNTQTLCLGPGMGLDSFWDLGWDSWAIIVYIIKYIYTYIYLFIYYNK